MISEYETKFAKNQRLYSIKIAENKELIGHHKYSHGKKHKRKSMNNTINNVGK